jgi:rhomboid protease GluP
VRQRSGSSLCYACGKLNRIDIARCFHCGAPRPGLWGFAPWLAWLTRRLSFGRLVSVVCVVAYLAALALDPQAALRPRGFLGALAPSGAALDTLGMTGAYAWAQGRWWTLVTAIYLHGGILHLVFNVLWINQLAPAVEDVYGRARLVAIFTVAGVLGFVVTVLVGVPFSVGASGAVFGLLGALVFYGRHRGGWFGVAVFRQYGQWALVLFILGFLMPGVNNLAHAGGFAGGYVAAQLLGYGERAPERGGHQLAAVAAIALTALSFALTIWSALAR